MNKEGKEYNTDVITCATMFTIISEGLPTFLEPSWMFKFDRWMEDLIRTCRPQVFRTTSCSLDQGRNGALPVAIGKNDRYFFLDLVTLQIKSATLYIIRSESQT